MIVVYTALFGEIDFLWSYLPVFGVKHVCFSDRPRKSVGMWTQPIGDIPKIQEHTHNLRTLRNAWEIRVVEPTYGNRRTARYYKALPHKHFPEADVTIWVDCNVRLRIPPNVAAKRWLKRNSFATFDHHERGCVYEEIEFCVLHGKGKRIRLLRQENRYRRYNMPHNYGLAETRCVIRRNDSLMARLNEMWWDELREYSVRDQVSLPFVFWRMGKKWNVIPGRACLETRPGYNSDFWFTKHVLKNV